MIITNAFIAGLFGLCFGSLLNVINLRFGQWRSIITTRSHCPECKTTLRWYDLVPILSFVTLKGKCRYCHKPISWQYPIVELLTAVITGLVWYALAPHSLTDIIHTLAVIGLSYVMILMAVEDYKDMTVSDQLLIAALLCAFVAAATSQLHFSTILWGIVAGAGPLAVLVLISRETWMGWGDVLLALSVGLVLGWPKALAWVFLAFIIGATLGLLLMALKLRGRKDPVPFVPMLLASFVVVIVWGGPIIDWYTSLFSF